MYVELHCRSAYSFLCGASHPEELVHHARLLGYGALALTDRNGIYGSMEFAQTARAMQLHAIIGAEVDIGLGARVVLLAETPRGYATLCRLLTRAHLSAPDRHLPQLAWEELVEAHTGLIVLCGGRAGLFQNRSSNDALRLAKVCYDVFGPDRFFVQLERNCVRGDRARCRTLTDLADHVGLPVVATGDVYYHQRDRHRLHDVLVAVRHRTTLDESHALRRPNAEFFLQPPAEMASRFMDRPDAVANTLAIAERCRAFDLTRDLGYRFPDFAGADDAPANRVLAELCAARLEVRYPTTSPHRDEASARLQEELTLIDHHGLAGFFLVYRDLLELGREVAREVRHGSCRVETGLPPGRGRGSSVSSIVCYLIGLSNVDPVAHQLFLGRFLNESLASVPDIDLDFPREIREVLIRKVYERYGAEHVGLVCSFPTYRLRSAVRDIGKALDLPRGELEQVAKLAEGRSAHALREELERIPGLTHRSREPLWQMLCEIADQIAGMPRHLSQHVGGMVISSRPLIEMVPLERSAMPDRVVCQWDKDSCDDARFIKIDFLSLGMLSLVEECVECIADCDGTVPDLSRIDFNDAAVYDQIIAGDTVGLFQIESRAQIQMLRRVRPRSIHDLAVQVAIVRPGPIVGGAVNPYVKRREAKRHDPNFTPTFAHPLVEDALGETLGVIIFQDQVLQVCQSLAGFSAGKAEQLRRAMSRRRSRDIMEEFREDFIRGAAARGVSLAVAEEVFSQVVAFSEFGFPKSHAAAFAVLAYQSAWLRHYYPVQYYAALFNNQPMGFYSLDALVRDAKRHDVDMLLPHLNRSEPRCHVESRAVRVGLAFVRGWGAEVAEAVVDERQRVGAYRSLPDFIRRAPVDLTRSAIENLIWVGGCDHFGLTRRELLWQTGLWLPPPGVEQGSHRRRQLELPLDHPHAKVRLRGVNDEDRVLAEYSTMGFATTAHPLALLRQNIPADVISSACLGQREHGADVQIAGVVVARQRPMTAKGFVFVLMEDEAGLVNVIIRPSLFDRDRVAIRGEPFLLVQGSVARDDGTINVLASSVRPLRVTSPRAPGAAEEPGRSRNPYALLTTLRQTPPDAKSWG